MAPRVLLLAILGALLCAPRAAGAQPPPLDGLDALVADAVDEWKVPGLAVVVIKDGAVVFSKGYGVRELGKPAVVDEHTLFAIGSTTKAMTAALVGILVDEKKLTWDDPVTKHLPWFAVGDPYVTREITVRDLLTHRTGLGNADYLWFGQDASARQVLERVRLLPQAYSLRSSFIYQNVMYSAAGAVIEAVSGRPWAEMMKVRLLDPLGMTESIATQATLDQQPNVAVPHAVVDGKLRVIENLSAAGVEPAGDVWSSLHDIAKWSAMLLAGGKANGRTILSEKTVDEIFAPQAIVPADEFDLTARLTQPKWKTYGLGWYQQDYRGHVVEHHTGGTEGLFAIHGLLRDQKVGVMVFANRDHSQVVRQAVMFTVFDRFIGGPRRYWSGELRTLYNGREEAADAERRKTEEQRVSGTRPSVPLAAYAGTYSDPLFGDIFVSVDQDRLRARYGSAYVGTLDHWHFDTFRSKWDAAWRGTELLTFELDKNGRPDRLETMGLRFNRAPD